MFDVLAVNSRAVLFAFRVRRHCMGELGRVYLGGPSSSAAEASGVGGFVSIDYYREIVRL